MVKEIIMSIEADKDDYPRMLAVIKEILDINNVLISKANNTYVLSIHNTYVHTIIEFKRLLKIRLANLKSIRLV